jgi:hypothetical protein
MTSMEIPHCLVATKGEAHPPPKKKYLKLRSNHPPSARGTSQLPRAEYPEESFNDDTEAEAGIVGMPPNKSNKCVLTRLLLKTPRGPGGAQASRLFGLQWGGGGEGRHKSVFESKRLKKISAAPGIWAISGQAPSPPQGSQN